MSRARREKKKAKRIREYLKALGPMTVWRVHWRNYPRSVGTIGASRP